MKKLFLMLATFVALFSIRATTTFSTTCPNKENLYPCECKPFANGLHITCANLENKEVLSSAFRVLHDYKIGKLFLHGVMLKEVLPGNILDGLQVNELKVAKSNLTFSQPAFSGLDKSLHILNVMENSTIKCSENFILATLNNLIKFIFKENSLGVVRNDWLNGKIPNVKEIELDKNSISIIENQAFASLLKLEFVSIAENRLKSVERSMFPKPANFLRKIDISGNQIKSLPLDFFHQMPKLKEVVLNENHLTTLREMVWKPVWQDLRIVLLKKNNLTCDDSLDWLRDLRWPKKEVNAECGRPEGLVGKSLKDVYKT